MSYRIMVNVVVDTAGKREWKFLRPTHNGKALPPYDWETKEEAERNLDMCYPRAERNGEVKVIQWEGK